MLLLIFLAASLLVLSSCENQSSTGTVGTIATSTPSPEPMITAAATVLPHPSLTPTPEQDMASIHMIDAMTGWATTHLYLYTEGGYVLRTTDGGIHWKNVSPRYAITHKVAEGYATDFLTASIAWVATADKDIFRTTDGGHTWQELSSIPSPSVSQASQLTFINPQDGWMILSTSDTAGPGDVIDIYRTTDGGVSWSKVSSTGTSASPNTSPGHLPLGGSEWGVSFLNASTGWATYQLSGTPLIQCYITHDGGSTWSLQTLAPPSSTTPFATLPPTFFTSSEGLLPALLFNRANGNKEELDVYVTHDGGANWSRTAFLSTYINLSSRLDAATSDVEFLDMNHGWVMNEQGTQLDRTSDGGHHWTTISFGTTISALSRFNFVSSQIGWAIGFLSIFNNSPPFLFKTEDGGRTWTEISFVVS